MRNSIKKTVLRRLPFLGWRRRSRRSRRSPRPNFTAAASTAAAGEVAGEAAVGAAPDGPATFRSNTRRGARELLDPEILRLGHSGRGRAMWTTLGFFVPPHIQLPRRAVSRQSRSRSLSTIARIAAFTSM